MEVAAARAADVFTTVSKVTADEAAIILARDPDILVYNGLNIDVISKIAEDEAVLEKRRAVLRHLAVVF